MTVREANELPEKAVFAGADRVNSTDTAGLSRTLSCSQDAARAARQDTSSGISPEP